MIVILPARSIALLLVNVPSVLIAKLLKLLKLVKEVLLWVIEATDNLNIVTATLFNVAAGATVSNGDVGGNIIAANLTIETGALNNINTDGDINGNITVNSFNE